jgi:ATP-dependent DNA ligase
MSHLNPGRTYGLTTRPELVVEVNYLTWTLDNLRRQVAYVGLREDKPARDVQRPVPHPKSRT